MSATPTKSLLEKPLLTEAEINMLKRRKNVQARSAHFGMFPPPSAREPVTITHPYKITPEQTEKGRAWFKSQLFTSTGKLNKQAQELLTDFDIGVIRTFDHFLFSGFVDVSDGLIKQYQPVYRVVASTGAWFEYVAGPYGVKTGGRWKRLRILRREPRQ